MSKELLEIIEKQLSNGANLSLYEKLAKKIEDEQNIKLPDVLQKKLDEIGNNPLDEKGLADKKEQINKLVTDGELDANEVLLELLEEIYSITDIEKMQSIHKIDINDLTRFAGAVSVKVFPIKEKNELGEDVLKEIPSQDALEPISYGVQKLLRTETKKYNRLLSKMKESLDKARDLEDAGESIAAELEIQDKLNEKTEKALQDLKNLTYKHSGLDTSEMSEWELELLYNKMISMTFGAYTPPMGKN